MTDDFLTAGHRFDEFGICVEPLSDYQRANTGHDRCPIQWWDIDDVDERWIHENGVAHSGQLSHGEVAQIKARKAAIVRKVCIATGWTP